MDARAITKLKDALYAAINDAETAAVEKLITFFKENLSEVNLAEPYKNGQHFLHIALERGAMDIATLLLDDLKDNKDIFRLDNKNCSPIWYAAARGKTKFLEKLIELARKRAHAKGGLPLWLVSDTENNSPLMKAAESTNIKTVTLLLGEIVNEENLLDIINQCNINGDTALHIACRAKIHDVIALLFEHGADLNVNNNDGDTPLIYLSKLTAEDQMAVFQCIKDTNQQLRFLKKYAKFIDNGAATEAAKDFYFATSRILENKAKGKNKIKNSKRDTNYFRLNRDRNIFSSSLRDVQNYLNNLQNKSTVSYGTRTVMLGLPALIFVIGIAEIIFCATMSQIKTNESLDVQNNWYEFFNRNHYAPVDMDQMIAEVASLREASRDYAYAIYGGGGLIILPLALFLLSLFIPFSKRIIESLWIRGPIVNRREYRELCNSLQNNILNKLQYLEAQQMTLPTDPQNIRNLELQVAALQHNQPLGQLKAILEQLNSVLKIILQDVNRQNFYRPQIPLTLFTQHEERVVPAIKDAEEYEKFDEDMASTIDGRTEQDIEMNIYHAYQQANEASDADEEDNLLAKSSRAYSAS